MRVLIVSDTHRRNDNYLNALQAAGKIDMLIHCGDVEGSEYTIEQTAGCEVHMVAGNNDFLSDLPNEEEFSIGRYKVWLTHGHSYRVSMDTSYLKQEALSRGADIVLFGHTHKPMAERIGGVHFINPGSLTYPRQEGRKPTYAILELDREQNISYKICTL